MKWRNRAPEKSPERETLTTGIRWWRWVFLVIGILTFPIPVLKEFSWGYLITSFIGIGLFLLLKHFARRIYYDKKNVYLLRGKREWVIPMTSIDSIKRSAASVNGSRYWIVRYKNEEGEKRSFRFFGSFFSEWKSDFNDTVSRAHPGVVIWTHPHFNH